jgi:hypothetical protein
VLPLEKLQSSKIFVVSNLQTEVKAAEQRNINKHSKTDAILQGLIFCRYHFPYKYYCGATF